jgi:Flp pilus assembly protein TadG
MHAVRTHLRRIARTGIRFRRAHGGNVAITFAIALIPLLAFVGAAIDYSRASKIKVQLQAALDSTALMVSKNAAKLTTSELVGTAKNYFLAQFTNPQAKKVNFSAAYSTSGGSSVVVNGSTDVDTTILGVIGINTISLNGSATAKWGSSRLRVALVLDTTGSMSSDSKINALKTATKNLLTQLEAAATVDGDVYVSIIPFSKNVNLDSSNYSANWINWTDWDAEPAILKNSKPNNWNQIGLGSSCPFSNNSYGFQCTRSPDNSSSTTSSIPSSGSYAGYICPGVDGGNKDSTKIGIYYNGCYDSVPTTSTSTQTVCTGRHCSCGNTSNCSCTGNGNNTVCTQTVTTTGAPYTHNWLVNNHNTWNGCVTDRGNSSGPVSDYDRLVTAPDSNIQATLFPAEQNFYCSPVVMGLSYNWSAMKNQVESLYPLGATNQPIGLVWGWQALVGGGPLTAPPKDSNYTYNDTIILLSDGLNTLDRWYGNGSSSTSLVDTRMVDSTGKGTCGNIKAAGITIYAVQVNTGGDPTSTLLQNCASSADKFFLLTSANQIIATFEAIGTNLTKLRIAQ